MALGDTPTSLVALGRAGTGAATILEGGYRPLEILMKGDQLEEMRQRRAMAEAAKQKENDYRDFLANAKFDTKGNLHFQAELDQLGQQAYTEMQKVATNPSLSRTEKAMQQRQIAARMQGQAHFSNEIGKGMQEVEALASDPRYDKEALRRRAFETLYDPVTHTKRSLLTYDPSVLSSIGSDPETFNKPLVAKKFADAVIQKDRLLMETAARPGRTGHAVTWESRGVEHNADGTPKIDPQTGLPIINVEKVLQDAKSDPMVNAIIERQLKQHQDVVTAALEKAQAKQPLSPEEQQVIQQESVKPRGYTDFLADLLTNQVYARKTVDRETFRPAPAAPRPRATAKPSSSEILVTPTVGSQLSPFVPPPSGRLQKMKDALGITPAPVSNHYPTVGVTFGSARRSYAEVSVDNHTAEIVGQEGKLTRAAAGNGKVPMQVVSRDYVLYVNGKRLGRKEAFTSDAEAYQHLLHTIEEMTPEQARKAELRAEYRGSFVDKAKTANDGSGGRPTPTGRNDTSGKNTYDTSVGEERLSVIVPATQATDAQLVQASGGKWNPRQPTPEQARVVEALTRKGGRVLTPYSYSTPNKASSSSAAGAGKYYQRPAAATAPSASTPAASSAGKYYQRPTH